MELAIAFPKAHPISPGFNTCDTFGSFKISPKTTPYKGQFAIDGYKERKLIPNLQSNLWYTNSSYESTNA
jgi:hypothetical protein